MNTGNMKTIYKDLLNAGAELSVSVTWELTFLTSSLTKGFLPDISVELYEKALLIASGNWHSWMRAGIYASFSSNIVSSIVDLAVWLFNRFASIFSKIWIKVPNLKWLDLDLGVFFND